MACFYDITEWEEREYLGTGGTRNKAVVENIEDGQLFFFKTSLNKIDKNYTYEFWSEVIASEVGRMLGFDTLQYDVAVRGQTMGCLSKLMVDQSREQLDEGHKWIKRYQTTYDAEDHNAYTFQIIEATLNRWFPDNRFVEKFISMLVFDSLIGNGDRHQENWGIIVSTKVEEETRGIWPTKKTSILKPSYKFAPIYDSGSSLGREKQDDVIRQMLTNKVQLDAYINRGQSEVHWDGCGKQKHFDLLDKISNAGYRDVINSEIGRIRSKYDVEEIGRIVNHVDDCLPDVFNMKKIPQIRKDLLIKLLTLRIERLLSHE